jgi:hypothetical protein
MMVPSLLKYARATDNGRTADVGFGEGWKRPSARAAQGEQGSGKHLHYTTLCIGAPDFCEGTTRARRVCIGQLSIWMRSIVGGSHVSDA